jgi:hypothetical protein
MRARRAGWLLMAAAMLAATSGEALARKGGRHHHHHRGASPLHSSCVAPLSVCLRPPARPTLIDPGALAPAVPEPTDKGIADFVLPAAPVTPSRD